MEVVEVDEVCIDDLPDEVLMRIVILSQEVQSTILVSRRWNAISNLYEVFLSLPKVSCTEAIWNKYFKERVDSLYENRRKLVRVDLEMALFSDISAYTFKLVHNGVYTPKSLFGNFIDSYRNLRDPDWEWVGIYMVSNLVGTLTSVKSLWALLLIYNWEENIPAYFGSGVVADMKRVYTHAISTMCWDPTGLLHLIDWSNYSMYNIMPQELIMANPEYHSQINWVYALRRPYPEPFLESLIILGYIRPTEMCRIIRTNTLSDAFINKYILNADSTYHVDYVLDVLQERVSRVSHKRHETEN
jgi:hypothetical protein